MEQGAIDVANINQKKHKDYKVEWVLANWLSAIDLSKVDVVIANPPYVETSWKDKGIQFEPNSALYSKEQGLNDIKLIINQLLNSNIKIWIEHGYQQDIKGFFDNNWQVTQHYDLSKNPRFINAIRIDHGKS
jgi:release factor glutamine methyltransferase